MRSDTTVSIAEDPVSIERPDLRDRPALVLLWSEEEPDRAGEVAFFDTPRRAEVIGRGDDGEEKGEVRVRFHRQRPRELIDGGGLSGRAISRRQVVVTPQAKGIEVRRVGRCPMLVNGQAVEAHVMAPGDTLLLKGQLLLRCTLRSRGMKELRYVAEQEFPFGGPDRVGILGETPVVWELRDRLAFAAKADTHVLLRGASGTGKELAARAIHELSKRAKRPLVSRNAATFPEGLIDAELFGNVKNYPNAGMPERPGLIGQADRGTLFLDEIAELPQDMQAHLLRVLDEGGEYQRLGETGSRKADVRLVGATNRDLASFKHDLLARIAVRVELPSLDARRDDIPLLVRHLVLRAARKSPEIADRFLRTVGGVSYPRIEPALLEALVSATFETNVRGLDTLLWKALSESPGDTIVVPEEMKRPRPAAEAESVREFTAEEIRGALALAKGNVSHAAKALGLSRYALYRWMRKFEIEGE